MLPVLQLPGVMTLGQVVGYRPSRAAILLGLGPGGVLHTVSIEELLHLIFRERFWLVPFLFLLPQDILHHRGSLGDVMKKGFVAASTRRKMRSPDLQAINRIR